MGRLRVWDRLYVMLRLFSSFWAFCIYLLHFLHAVPMGRVPETDSSLSSGASSNLCTAPMFLKHIWINAVQNEQFGTSFSRWLPQLVSASNIREPRKVPGWERHCDEVTAIARVWWKGAACHHFPIMPLPLGKNSYHLSCHHFSSRNNIRKCPE